MSKQIIELINALGINLTPTQLILLTITTFLSTYLYKVIIKIFNPEVSIFVPENIFSVAKHRIGFWLIFTVNVIFVVLFLGLLIIFILFTISFINPLKLIPVTFSFCMSIFMLSYLIYQCVYTYRTFKTDKSYFPLVEIDNIKYYITNTLKDGGYVGRTKKQIDEKNKSYRRIDSSEIKEFELVERSKIFENK